MPEPVTNLPKKPDPSYDPYNMDEPASSPTPSSAGREPAAGSSSPAAVPPRNPDGTFATRGHTPAMKQLASELGMSDEDIEATSPEVLQQSLAVSSKLAMQMHKRRQEDSLQSALEKGSERSAGPSTVPPGTVDVPDGFDWGKNDEGKPYKESDYDPGLAAVIRRFDQRLKQLEGGLQQVHQFQQARVNESIGQKCDRFFNKHTDIFGTGEYAELDPKGREMARRVAVYKHAAGINSKASLEKKLEEAKEFLFGGLAGTPPAPAAPQETVEQRAWREASLAVPTQRSPNPERKGPKKAEETVRQFQRDTAAQNGTPASDDEFIL